MPGLLAVLLTMIDDRTKAGFDAAGDSVKQLLALATGSIGGTIALFDESGTAGINLGDSRGVYLGLAFLALSVICGLFALGMLAGQLGSVKINAPSTYAPPVRLMAGGQMLMFGLAIAALVVATILGL